MQIIRRALERGFTNLGWLKSYHTFSFGGYYNPIFHGFESLRVINEDIVLPMSGFSSHSHKDMEIISYVLSGSLKHKDSIGNLGIIQAGEVQRMTAGSGITHSEYNASDSNEVHFLQIWIIPSVRNLTPGYKQKFFDPLKRKGQFVLFASPTGHDGSLMIHQDTNLWCGIIDQKHPSLNYILSPNRKAWVHVVRGELSLNDIELRTGDGVGITAPEMLRFHKPYIESEVLLFDLAAD
jgi:redox-sensitive bicupin YhaK (pirin superfamily)